MSPPIAGAVGFVILLALMFLGMPIGFAMSLVGLVGFIYVVDLGAGLSLLGTIPYATVASYPVSMIPMFILMGEFAFHSGITADLYYLANKWIGHLPGGLAMATIGGCAGFAACTGSAVAPAAMFATVSLPEMKKYNYDPSLATGCIAAGGTLGILIPPSIAFVFYGFMTSESVGRLFIAGIFPGVLLSALFMFLIWAMCRWRPWLGPPAPRASWKERMVALRGGWAMLLLFLLVIGGIYLGVFTPTEGGGVGAAGAFIIALIKRQLTWQAFLSSLGSTLVITAMVFILLIGAYIFGAFIAVSKLPFVLSDMASGSAMPPLVILIGILIVYLVLGAVSDILSAFVLTLPIVFPVAVALGYDPIWFGVILVIMVQMGLITPPIGLDVFVVGGIAKDIPMDTIFRGVFPFVGAMFVCIAILIAFPQIATFLPSMMKG